MGRQIYLIAHREETWPIYSTRKSGQSMIIENSTLQIIDV